MKDMLQFQTVHWQTFRRKMQLRKQKPIAYLMVIFILVGSYFYINLQSYAYYTNRFWNPVVSCKGSDEEIDRLLKLAYQIHTVLDSMEIRHWLMYGSIWGALRIGKPLPWDNDVDIGFEEQGKFARMTWSEFLAPFEAEGLNIKTKWTQSGTIVISKPDLWQSVDLFALYNQRGTMKRRGVESGIFALNYMTYHQFPAWLVESDLPQAKFGFFNISVPKGGIEIMKHLYPFNWWKDVRPKGC